MHVCMYVCLRPRSMCMYVCLTPRGKRVCLRLLDVCVCMSQTQKTSMFRRVSNSLRKPFKFKRLIAFFLNREGGYFWEPSQGANVYVCMFEFPDVCVCMSDTPRQACMSETPGRVCMYVSNLENFYVSEGVKFLTKSIQI